MRGSQKYMKPEGKAYKLAVAEIVAEQGCETMDGRVAVFVRAFMPDNRRRDIMNLEKILSDSLTSAGVWLDDSQIDDFRIVRGAVEKGGRVEVVITEIQE
jgi:crossover junction endodeoxyribonuclease RusA